MSSKLVNSAASRDIAYHLHPYTHLKQHEEDGSLIIARGEGVRVFDIDGNAYIEGMAGLWCTALGFSEERLIEAAQRQMKTLPFYHSFNSKASDVIGALAQEIIDLAPVPMSKVFFANSGSEAIDTAIKLVWYYNNALDRPEKRKLSHVKRHTTVSPLPRPASQDYRIITVTLICRLPVCCIRTVRIITDTPKMVNRKKNFQRGWQIT